MRMHPCSLRGPLAGPVLTLSRDLQAHAAQLIDEYLTPARQGMLPQPIAAVAACDRLAATAKTPTAAQMRLAALRGRVTAREGAAV